MGFGQCQVVEGALFGRRGPMQHPVLGQLPRLLTIPSIEQTACLVRHAIPPKPIRPPPTRQCLRLPDRRFSSVHITEARLQEFLRAEVAFFAGQEASSITLRQILDASTPAKAAALSNEQLPIRYAQRIVQIEELPGWSSSPEITEVHRLYSQSFRDLRLVALDFDKLEPFTKLVQELKNRMKPVIQHLAIGMRNLQTTERFSEQLIGQFLDSFLLSRIGTEMLTSQYIACVSPEPAARRRSRKGIVDDGCDPVAICEQAARHAKKLCKEHYGMTQDVRVVVESSATRTGDLSPIRFPYVPQYLYYIMVELLKNSARATVESTQESPQKMEEKPITITVGADQMDVVIRVNDVAGGIPFNVADRVWSYMYSTATQKGGELQKSESPLAGYGVGLPLSRLYARYLGGSLHLKSLPGVGTSAYLYLKRVETDAREELPLELSSISSMHV